AARPRRRQRRRHHHRQEHRHRQGRGHLRPGHPHHLRQRLPPPGPRVRSGDLRQRCGNPVLLQRPGQPHHPIPPHLPPPPPRLPPSRPADHHTSTPPRHGTLGAPLEGTVHPPGSGITVGGYLYQRNGGPPAQVTKNGDGSGSLPMTPNRYTNVLTVTEVSPGG